MSDDGDLHQISAEIGGLKTAVEMMMNQWQRQEEAASAGRKALHDKVEMVRQELGIEVSGLGLRVDRLTDKVTLIEPSVVKLKEDVKEFDDEKLREEGARRFRTKLGAAITLAAGAVGYGLHELIGYLKPH